MKLFSKKFLQKKENLYFVLALVIGMVMVFLNPPFAGVPDEGAHYLRAANIAEGNILCSKDGKINKASYDLADEIKPIKVNGSNDQKISLGRIKGALLQKDSQEVIPFGGANCVANPSGYLPQVVGIKIADVINVPVLWGFYFARLLNLTLAIFITYLAIKLLPFGKIVFLLIALLPMTMQQYASMSYDALNISLIFLFTAFVLKLAVDSKRISRKELLLLTLSALLAANIKWGFLPIMLLLFVLPKDKFENKKKYWSYILGTIILGAGMFLIAQIGSVNSEGPREGVYPLEQIIMVSKNPVNFLYVVTNTLYSGANFFFETFIYKPGWLDNSLSPLFYLFFFLGMIFLIRSEKEEVNLTKQQRVIIGATFLVGLLFVFFSLYVFWTKVGGDKVQGVQGRYLISIFPLLIIAFYKSKFSFRSDWIAKNMAKAIWIFLAIVFITSFVSIWKIYYDKSENIGKYIYESTISKEEVKSATPMDVQGAFTQTFKSTKTEFLGIKFYVKKDFYTGKAIFYLKDSECKEILRKKELMWDQDEFSSIELKFGVVANSKDKSFCLQGETGETKLQMKIVKDKYEEGLFILNGKEQIEDLVFDLMYEN